MATKLLSDSAHGVIHLSMAAEQYVKINLDIETVIIQPLLEIINNVCINLLLHCFLGLFVC